MLGRRLILTGAAAFTATALASRREGAVAREAAAGPWAVELFTSQGCSSCPPADRLLGMLARRADIVALSYHVDYWDYIGWKDKFASSTTTLRQRAYARNLKQRYVYTPEMVVDGIVHRPAVTSASVEDMLDQARSRCPRRATPELTHAVNAPLVIRLAPFDLGHEPADIALAVYDRRVATKIGAGENDGRTLENFNIVRHFEVVSRWDGSSAQWTVPADRFGPEQGVAVLVQRANQGQIIGCNKLEPIATN
ncbi:hypothetical protein SAMN02745126_03233 [Enhydrobacter aerosaccus]|uniref:DUF1223 domain-containing protein n=1 Tax=Enhydrobacter aerosaccus TaxID=225324 RepID=A0A1T4QI77_9HYPH|nr:DUF1223 domain-containing protein [Enhydrobacter aerosaccus]SKA03191.1 hypothetical protein SAMN02745126_03233 [Enhydrobacter aerosaccus]